MNSTKTLTEAKLLHRALKNVSHFQNRARWDLLSSRYAACLSRMDHAMLMMHVRSV